MGAGKKLIQTMDSLEKKSPDTDFDLKQKELVKILQKEITAKEKGISRKDKEIRRLRLDSFSDKSQLIQSLCTKLDKLLRKMRKLVQKLKNLLRIVKKFQDSKDSRKIRKLMLHIKEEEEICIAYV